jgi:hypothetical protein
MGSRLEYYILFRSKFKQRINVGKGINIEEIAQRAISSRYGNFVFVVYLVLGLLIIFMKDFPYRYGYRIALEFFSSYTFIRGIRIINDNKD